MEKGSYHSSSADFFMAAVHVFLLAAGSNIYPVACSGQYESAGKPLQKNGSLYEIRLHGQSLEIDPKNGGRIISLNIGKINFLTDSTVNAFNWGSTFWPSPQKDWKWPPPAEWDNKPYKVISDDTVLKMESAPDPKTGLGVQKLFSGDTKNNIYNLEYIITNYSDSARKIAPWEVTRVHTGGFCFFPMGDGIKTGDFVPMTTDINGICWFSFQEKIPDHGDPQLYTDGHEGWFAQVNRNIILIKKFPDMHLQDVAPREGEIELYANKGIPSKRYVEIEHQGKYTELNPGQSITWKMQWFLRKLPHNIKPKIGNAKLTGFVRNILK